MTAPRTCDTCSALEPAPSAFLDVSDGRVLCAPCWNVETTAGAKARRLELAQARAARKAADALRPPALFDTGGWSAAAQLGAKVGR